MHAVRTLLLAAAAALAACASGPRAPTVALDVALDLPPDLAAARVAAAARAALPFADPVPYAAGAPATAGADGRFTVRYEERRGAWLPRADHRLQAAGPRVVVEDAAGLFGFGLGCREVLELEVTPDGAGARVRGVVPARLAEGLRAAIGAPEPSATVTAPHRLDRAMAFAQIGDADRARCLRDHAALVADPAGRAAALRSVIVADSAPSARRLAEERLRADDLAAARVLLHTARRTGPAPELDYRLAWQLHRLEGDGEGALAAALLAREYGSLGAGMLVAAELRAGDAAAAPAAPPGR